MHDLIGPLYVNCEDAEARPHILDNLIQEETGRMSKSAPHPELYIRLGCALGSTRETMRSIYPLPETLVLRTYWVRVVAHRPFAEGLAAVSIAGEAQIPGAGNEFTRILEEKYGLSHDDTAFGGSMMRPTASTAAAPSSSSRNWRGRMMSRSASEKRWITPWSCCGVSSTGSSWHTDNTGKRRRICV